MIASKLYRVIFVVAIFCCGAISPLTAAGDDRDVATMNLDELWDGANTSYANGNYVEAKALYSAILERGFHSAELYYNLGNLHYKRRELGRSLLYYYRALRLDPTDSDILHNIEVVRAETTDNIEVMPRLFFVEWGEWLSSKLSYVGWSVLSLVLFATMLTMLLLYLLASSLKMRRCGFWATVLSALLFVLATSNALSARSEMLNPSEAVVMSKSLAVSSSPNVGSTELFILHEGTKVEILTRHDSWCEIVIADGKRGWVESAKIENI